MAHAQPRTAHAHTEASTDPETAVAPTSTQKGDAGSIRAPEGRERRVPVGEVRRLIEELRTCP